MVNRMRHTRAHTRNRRSHHALTAASGVLCKDCGHPKLRHLACAGCGKYKGRVVGKVAAKLAKKSTRKTTKAGAAK